MLINQGNRKSKKLIQAKLGHKNLNMDHYEGTMPRSFQAGERKTRFGSSFLLGLLEVALRNAVVYGGSE